MLRFLLTLTAGIIALVATAQTTLKQEMLPGNMGAIAKSSVPVAPLVEVRRALGQPATVLLDVRTPAEFAAGHLPGAQNLDFRAPDFAQQVARLAPQTPYVLYCASGNRSSQAAIIMQEKGFRKVVNAGAFKDLNAAGVRKQ